MSYFPANTKRYNPIREARKFSIVPHKFPRRPCLWSGKRVSTFENEPSLCFFFAETFQGYIYEGLMRDGLGI